MQRFGLLSLFIIVFLSAAVAQDQKLGLEGLRINLEKIEDVISLPQASEEDLLKNRAALDPIREYLWKTIDDADTKLKALQARLAQVSDKNQPAAKEVAPLTNERQELEAQSTALDNDLKQRRLLLVRVDQINEEIVQKRRMLFTSRIFARVDSLLEPTFWQEAATTLPNFLNSIQKILISGVLKIIDPDHLRNVGILLIGIFAIIGFTFFLQNRFHEKLNIFLQKNQERHQRLSATSSFSRLLIDGLLPFIAFFACAYLISTLGLLTTATAKLVNLFVAAYGFYLFSTRPAKSILDSSFHFVDLGSPLHKCKMEALISFKSCALIIFITMIALGSINIANGSVVLHAITSSLAGFTFSFVLLAGLYKVSRTEDQLEDPEDGTLLSSAPFGWRGVRLALWLVGFIILAASLLGYSAFSLFLSYQTLWVLGATALFSLTTCMLKEVITHLTAPTSPRAKRVAKLFGFDARQVEQIGTVASGVLRALTFILLLFAVIAPWGLDQKDALASLKNAFFSISLGGFNLSLANILQAALLFGFALFITGLIKSWFSEELLPTTKLDIGLKNSIATTIGYLGFIFAAVLGFSTLGLDVKNLAIVAGALSVGIGFGLQSIVGNFVSGLILLAERPIKTGDWIVAGDAEGYVKKINVRSTEIETFDNAVLIVPNSNLISNVVRNWMHNDSQGRAKIKLNVAHDTDPELVKKILLAAVEDHPNILKKPEPGVFLVGISEFALTFEMSFTIAQVDRAYGIKSDLHYDILKRFRDEMISLR